MGELQAGIDRILASSLLATTDGISSELRSLLDAIPAAVFLSPDVTCATVYGNAAAEALLCAPKGANLSYSAASPAGFKPFEMLDERGRPLSPDALPVRRAARGEQVCGAEIRLHYRDGHDIWLHGNAFPLSDARGRNWGAIAAFVDVSLMKGAETKLAASNAALAKLMAAASHDLRQPVQAMSLILTALLRQAPDELRPMVAQLGTCLSLLTSQLDGLMDLGRVSAGVVTLDYQTIPVHEILARAVDTVAPMAADKGIALRLRRCTARVRTDRMLAERIVVNLVHNAVKYTRTGGVLIGCRRRGNRLHVQISDTGVGISSEHIGAIWSEFYQVDASAKGVGLGLAIVDHTARLLGSRVTVKSRPGKGSTFALDLPLA